MAGIHLGAFEQGVLRLQAQSYRRAKERGEKPPLHPQLNTVLGDIFDGLEYWEERSAGQIEESRKQAVERLDGHTFRRLARSRDAGIEVSAALDYALEHYGQIAPSSSENRDNLVQDAKAQIQKSAEAFFERWLTALESELGQITTIRKYELDNIDEWRRSLSGNLAKYTEAGFETSSAITSKLLAWRQAAVEKILFTAGTEEMDQRLILAIHLASFGEPAHTLAPSFLDIIARYRDSILQEAIFGSGKIMATTLGKAAEIQKAIPELEPNLRLWNQVRSALVLQEIQGEDFKTLPPYAQLKKLSGIYEDYLSPEAVRRGIQLDGVAVRGYQMVWKSSISKGVVEFIDSSDANFFRFQDIQQFINLGAERKLPMNYSKGALLAKAEEALARQVDELEADGRSYLLTIVRNMLEFAAFAGIDVAAYRARIEKK